MSDENKKHEQEIDKVSGVETTGHEWDGLKELNNPLPRWWLWVFLFTCIWSVWYWVEYPAWPTVEGHTEGSLGYTQEKELAEKQGDIMKRKAAYLDRFEEASYPEILEDGELYAFATAGGAAAFKDNCATCHGTGGVGAKGYPNLNDDDWLWGGTLADIEETINYGIRFQHDETRLSQMPAFGRGGLLKKDEIEAVTDYVLSLSGGEKKQSFAMGERVYKEQCMTCHGEDGKGDQSVGAPNLTDRIWLYGGDRKTVYETIYYARAGVMPAWTNRLDKNTIRQLTVYLHQLGGGEEEAMSHGETEQE